MTAAVGSSQSPGGCVGSGSITIFDLNQGEWTRQVELVPSGRTANDGFPASVMIAGDSLIANTASRFTGGNNDDGIFTKIDGNWSETQQLIINDHLDRLLHDGDTLVVATDSGQKLLIFSRELDGMWRQSSEIEPNGVVSVFELFGNTLVTGSTNTDILTIYENTDDSWQVVAEFILDPGAILWAPSGTHLDINANSIVYTPVQRTGDFPSAYTFRRDAESIWLQTTGVIAPNVASTVGDSRALNYYPDAYLLFRNRWGSDAVHARCSLQYSFRHRIFVTWHSTPRFTGV